MKRLLTVTLAWIVLVCVMSVQSLDETHTQPGEAPWHVSVQCKVFGTISYHCFSGVIIDENHILTSADINPDVLPDLTLLVGRVDLNGFGGYRRNIGPMTFHPDFHVVWPVLDFPNRHDISIFRVTQPFVWSEDVQPLPLPKGNQSLVGETGLLTGWYGPVIDGAGNQWKVNMPIISHQVCDKYYGIYRIPKDNMFCGGDVDEEENSIGITTSWDRGSPMACRDVEDGTPYLCGLYVHTPQYRDLCDAPTPPGVKGGRASSKTVGVGYPTALLNVAHYAEWIEGVIADVK